jgi:hypothetical protein
MSIQLSNIITDGITTMYSGLFYINKSYLYKEMNLYVKARDTIEEVTTLTGTFESNEEE